MTSFAVLMDISKREVFAKKKKVALLVNYRSTLSVSSPLPWRPSPARRRPPPEDRHLHHGVRLLVSPPPHAHLAVPPAPSPLQPPRHPQEPGGGAFLLRARLPAGHKSDRQRGRCRVNMRHLRVYVQHVPCG